VLLRGPSQVRCRKLLAEDGTVVSTYSKVGFHACGEVGERAVDTLVVISQGSCCVAYLIFISQNLTSIVCRPSHPSPVCLSGAGFVLLGTPLQVPTHFHTLTHKHFTPLRRLFACFLLWTEL